MMQFNQLTYRKLFFNRIFISILIGSFIISCAKPKESLDNERYRIMITFSWSFSNIGSIGITNGVMNLIEKYIPNSEVIIVADDYSDELVDYFTDRYSNIIDIIPSPFYNSDKSITMDEFKRIQDPVSALPFMGIPDNDAALKFMDAISNVDFLLYNSGTMMAYGRWNYQPIRLMRYSWPLIIAREMGIKYGIYANSFERFAWPSNMLMVPVLNNCEFIFFRDGNSLNYLKELGVKSKVMEFAPDATFAFHETDEINGQKLLNSFNLVESEFITLTIRSGRSGQGFVIGGSDRELMHAEKLVDVIKRYIDNTNNKVLICPEYAGEIEPARELIYDRLDDKTVKYVEFLDEFWPPEVANYVYSKAESIITMEGHSVIMGIAMGTPVIHPRFLESGRKAWMLNDLGLEKWLFDIDENSADDIYRELEYIHLNFDEAKNDIKKANQYIEQRQKESMKIFKQQLASIRPK